MEIMKQLALGCGQGIAYLQHLGTIPIIIAVPSLLQVLEGFRRQLGEDGAPRASEPSPHV